MMNKGKWNEKEEKAFFLAFEQYRDLSSKNIQHLLKKTDWRAVAKVVQTRTVTQTWLYARQFLRSRLKKKKKKQSAAIGLADNLYKLSSIEARDYLTLHENEDEIHHDLHFIVEAPLIHSDGTSTSAIDATTNVYFAATGLEKVHLDPFDHNLDDISPLDIHFTLPDPFADCDIQKEAYLF